MPAETLRLPSSNIPGDIKVIRPPPPGPALPFVSPPSASNLPKLYKLAASIRIAPPDPAPAFPAPRDSASPPFVEMVVFASRTKVPPTTNEIAPPPPPALALLPLDLPPPEPPTNSVRLLSP